MKMLIIMGLIALGIGQITAEEVSPDGIPMRLMPKQRVAPEQPQIGWTTVVSTITLVAQGGQYFYECTPGRLPWHRGECRKFVTGNAGCNHWNDEAETTHNWVRCDGQSHTFPTLTYWIQTDNQFEQVGSVTPTVNVPAICQSEVDYNYTLNVTTRSCVQPCAANRYRCDPPDPVCPPYCYNIPPICCLEGWECYTVWDPIGQLYYGTCCHQTPWGTVCE
jgi:hypothetical protein